MPASIASSSRRNTGTQLRIWDCNANAWQKWTLPG